MPGFEGSYEVSDMGHVRSVDRVVVDSRGRGFRRRGQILKPKHNNMGYPYVCLGRPNSRLVHRLVLMAFVGPCPEGMVGCHNNDIPTDNRLENLRWDTMAANQFDRIANGNNAFANQTHCKRGHEFTPKNTRIKLSGSGRECRECDRLRGSHAKRIKRSEMSA